MRNSARWMAVLGAILLALLAVSLFSRGNAKPQIPYTKVETLIEQGKVAEVELRGHELSGKFTAAEEFDPDRPATKTFQSRIPDFGDTGILDLLKKHHVQVNVVNAQGSGWTGLLGLLPWILIIGAWIWMSRRSIKQATSMYGGGLGQLAQSRMKRAKPEAAHTRFSDIAGQDAVKRDIVELVVFLKDPRRYEKLGAVVPHGVLLYGPPGTGKTLMARALAGEAGVPFFHVSGSEFIEMVVGIGASRVRKTFDEAKKHQPAILFIDEIDAIGRRRGAGMGGGHDEREQTLNQILTEMDGFSEKEAIIVVAATNRPDVLDPALLRPGRFDRRLALELPDRKAREAILRIHTRDVPLADNVDLAAIAAGSPGFSGADIKNLVNEAAMLAARDSAERVNGRYFDEARDKILMGPSRPLTLQEDERHRIAVHESGHTAVAHFLPRADPLLKVTIIPRGRALGGTEQMPEAERYISDENYLRDRLAVMLAGRASEQAFLGNVSSGADDDIHQATKLARAMVSRWGMSAEVGPIDLRIGDDHPFLGLDMTRERQFSERTAYEVDQAVKKLLSEATNRAIKLIQGHRSRIETLIAALEENEVLDADQIGQCLGRRDDNVALAPTAAAGG